MSDFSRSGFPVPADPTPGHAAFEDTLVRWVVVLLPALVVVHLIGAATIVAVLVSLNFNVLGWLE